MSYDQEVESADDTARWLAALMLADQMHEIIEFTRVDGVRLADPHPTGESFSWMADRMRKVVDEYIAKFPPRAEVCCE